jgi:DNA-directed RNA polymerase specialized sigma24 family protein
MLRSNSAERLVACLPILRGYLRRLAGDQQVEREVLQESCVRILAGKGPDDPERFIGWCCGIARNVLALDRRTRRRTRAELPLDEQLIDELYAPQRDPEGHCDARAWMARATDLMDRAGLELLVRRYVLEETGQELADEQAQSSAALRMRLMRLRSTLLEQPRRRPVGPVTPPPVPRAPGFVRSLPGPAPGRRPP